MKKKGRTVVCAAFVACFVGGVVAACTINPQPLPPFAPEDAGRAGVDGGSNFGAGGGGGDGSDVGTVPVSGQDGGDGGDASSTDAEVDGGEGGALDSD